MMNLNSVLVAACILLVGISGRPAFGERPESRSAAPDEQQASVVATRPVTVQTARAQAASLHDALHTMLQVTHDRFYREDEGLPIPAATLKDVFAELKKKQDITVRWLVVDGQAMNVDHKPQDEFERMAVKVRTSGKPLHEQIVNGVYRRAGPITLSNHCLKCHVPNRRSTRDRTAGLIIDIPVRGQ